MSSSQQNIKVPTWSHDVWPPNILQNITWTVTAMSTLNNSQRRSLPYRPGYITLVKTTSAQLDCTLSTITPYCCLPHTIAVPTLFFQISWIFFPSSKNEVRLIPFVVFAHTHLNVHTHIHTCTHTDTHT